MSNTQTLDDTLKELLGDDPEGKVNNTDANTEGEKPKRTRRTKAQIEAEKAEAEKAEAAPEVIPDTDLDKAPDIEEPEIEEPKKEVIHPRGEAIAAFSNEKEESKSIVGTQIILRKPTAMYRARHFSMRVRSYQGLVTVIEEPKQGFVKVQFLRQGFGLCESYMTIFDLDQDPKTEGDSDDIS